MENDIWLEDSFDYEPNALKQSVSAEVSVATTAEYIVAVSTAFAILGEYMIHKWREPYLRTAKILFREEKELVHRCLDIFTKLATVSENKAMFLKVCVRSSDPYKRVSCTR
jgi:hypothetical protein